MTRRIQAIAATVLFAAATIGAAAADGLTHTSTRPLLTALAEALPALLLGVGAILSATRGARLFALAMLALACGVVATSGTRPDGLGIALVALFVASVLLAAAFLRAAAATPGRRRVVVALLVPLVALAGLLTAIGVSSQVSVSSTRCGVDNCAYAGLGVAFGLGAACELILLVVLVAALGAHPRAGAGTALFAVGLNLILAIAPNWSQSQGIVGIAIAYAGLGLAAVPWFVAPRAAAVVSLPLPLPDC